MNPRIVDYDIISAELSMELIEYVRAAIKSGWQPFGNALIEEGTEHENGDGEVGWLYQPMVKYEMVSKTRREVNLERSIEDLGLSVRAQTCLDRTEIKKVGEICQKTEEYFIRMKNFGATSLNELKHKLDLMGLSLYSNKGR